MAKSTKALSGPAKRKFLRDVVAAEKGLEADVVRRLADRLDADISQIRVRTHAAISTSVETAAAASVAPVPAPSPVAPVAAVGDRPFDPHAFSLVVVMTKQGGDGLLRRLETVLAADHLREIASAQHVTIDTSLTDPSALRAAIVAGTAERIAHRRAAAS